MKIVDNSHQGSLLPSGIKLSDERYRDLLLVRGPKGVPLFRAVPEGQRLEYARACAKMDSTTPERAYRILKWPDVYVEDLLDAIIPKIAEDPVVGLKALDKTIVQNRYALFLINNFFSGNVEKEQIDEAPHSIYLQEKPQTLFIKAYGSYANREDIRDLDNSACTELFNIGRESRLSDLLELSPPLLKRVRRAYFVWRDSAFKDGFTANLKIAMQEGSTEEWLDSIEDSVIDSPEGYGGGRYRNVA